MTLTLLHGGGDGPARNAAFGPFVEALPLGQAARLALVICEPDAASQRESATAYGEMARTLTEAQLLPLFATPDAPLTAARLREARPDGLLICGGATPFYQAALCVDTGWLGWAQEAGLPLAGTSAGAAILAEHAIVGGWRAMRDGRERAILFAGAGEGLDALEVRPGLGLIGGAVDVHASQMGTLLRLVHAVELGLAPHGWAIDENTALVLSDGPLRVVGAGQAYHVTPGSSGGVQVTIHPAQ